MFIKTVNVIISCCCLAEDGTDFFIRACCTCSTIMFPLSTSQTLNYGAVVAVPLLMLQIPAKYSRNDTVFKIGHHAKAVVFEKWPVTVKT